MNVNYTFIVGLLRKCTVILSVLILMQVVYDFDRPVVPPTLEDYKQLHETDAIRFSAESGFYEESFSLEMEAEGILPEGAQIHYTLDGSEPNEQSPIYDGPILLQAVSAPDNSNVSDFRNTQASESMLNGEDAQNSEAALYGEDAQNPEGALAADYVQNPEEALYGENAQNPEGTTYVYDAQNSEAALYGEDAQNPEGALAADHASGLETAGAAGNEMYGDGLSSSFISSSDQGDDTSGAHYKADNPAAGTIVYTVRAKILCRGEETATQYAVYGIGTGVLPGKGEYIVCVDTEDVNINDYDTGILVGGRSLDEHDESKYHGNYMERGDDWVRPCHVAIFDGEGNYVEGKSAGLSVSGGMSRRLAQKSLNLAFGDPWCGEDSDGHLDLDIFPDQREVNYSHVASYTHLRLRARSQTTRTFRESLVCETAGKSGNPAVSSSRSGIVFLNGSFYTLAEMEPTFSDSYLAHRYDLPDTDNIEKKKGKESSVFRKTNVSDLFAADLTEEKNREALEAAVDIDDYLLYYAVNVLDNNLDWPRNNVGVWRYTGEYNPDYPYTDGKLRFVVFDSDKIYNTDPSLEEDFGTDNFISMMTNTKRGYESRFRDVMRAEPYRERFVTIVCDLINTSFEQQRVQEIIRENYESKEEMYRAYYTSEYMTRVEEDQKAALKAAAERNDIVRKDLEKYFGLKDQFQIDVSASKGASVSWNNMYVAPEKEYTGFYYKGTPITLTAEAAPGWSFDHWEVNGKAVGKEDTLTIDMEKRKSEHVSVSAVAIPEHAEKLVIAEFSSAGTDDWIRLYNAGTTELNLGSYCLSDEPENPNLFRLPSVTLAPGESFLVGCSKNTNGTFSCCCNFSLARNEVLTLTQDDAKGGASDSVRVPCMSPGYTYGRRDNGNSFCWFDRRSE